MKDKRYYVTIELTAQLSGSIEKDTEENRRKIASKIYDHIWGRDKKKGIDYSCYLHNGNILSINDEKGRTISW